MSPPLITLLTDFGLSDHYVAAMKGVILSICPAARLVDISHEIRAFDIPQGAFTLGQAYACFPPGSIHLAVVDPGVGSQRRPILVAADGHYFVGPDNGLFSVALHRDPRHTLRHITSTEYFRRPVSQTFHGRDIFAPVAAHLGAGVPPECFGPSCENAQRMDFGPPVRRQADLWEGFIIYVDQFGNIVTNFRPTDVPELNTAAFEMTTGSTTTSRYRRAYAESAEGECFVIEGSSGYLEVSINQADAAQRAGVARGAPVWLRAECGGVLGYG